MNEDINKVLAMPYVQEKMEQYGAENGGGSTKKFANFIKAEQVKWAQVAADGLRPDQGGGLNQRFNARGWS